MNQNAHLKIGIIGHGEIGKSIEAVYKRKDIKPNVKDLAYEGDVYDCDFMHVCIPYTEKFVDIVSAYIQKYNPKNVIVHSTINVGTIQRIKALTNSKICHSPIRGLHPNLDLGILTFMIYVGTPDTELFDKVKNLYEFLGIPSIKHCDKYETTELAKLLDTTYYGICIAFHKEVKNLCEQLNLDFNQVMSDYNASYNEGYAKLGKSNVIRPVLKDMPGPIGGHCVVPNAQILTGIWDSKVLELILKYKG